MHIINRYCIYCGSTANSKDHVPPKLLLELPYPQNLKTVNSCKKCNNGYSKDEQYFLILLGQIATNAQLAIKMAEGGTIHRALKRAPRLKNSFRAAERVDGKGKTFIAADLKRVYRVITKIAHGLYVLRYNWNPGKSGFRAYGIYPYNIEEYRPPEIIAAAFTERFNPKRWKTVQNGVFSYLFVRDPFSKSILCIMDFHLTAWGVVSVVVPKRRKMSI